AALHPGAVRRPPRRAGAHADAADQPAHGPGRPMMSPSASQVAAGVHRIPLGGGFVNAYLLETTGGLVLVDSGVPGSEQAVLGAIAEAGHEPSSLTTVLLTHAHLDHSGSAAAVREATGARLLLSKPDADLIASG